jgi:hypothetical protein
MSTIFAGSVNGNNNTQGVTNSRLLTNSNDFREVLISRNLYDLDKEYNLSNPTTGSKIVDSINSIATIVAPFKSFNLENTVYGRLIDNPTPLTKIGLAMLGTQLAYNASSHISQQTLPVIKISNLFDGNPKTKLFTANKDYRVTTRADIGTFSNFIDRLKFWYPKKDNDFDSQSTNNDYIKKTGTGQLSFLFQAVNKNIFKPNNNTENNVFITYADKANESIKPRISLGKTTFFTFDNKKFYPYLYNSTALSNFVDRANKGMYNSFNLDGNTIQEYAADVDYIKNLGKTFSLKNKTEINEWVDENTTTEFSNDNLLDKFIWGSTGVNDLIDKTNKELRGDTDEVKNNFESTKRNITTKFDVRKGLLEYTRNLLTASGGESIDITKKAFKKGDKFVGYNGSALWTANDSKYIGDNAGKSGIRQHSALDQYDRFAKAIRFNGNELYNGNENSVIYKSVLPRIHPTIDTTSNKNIINNRNLMFSIENLAVGVFANDPNDDYAIMDDEYGTQIPVSELGAFNGRVMWFPPYGINIQETAIAKFESTVMIGRNEPMYNYMNSERSATLTFTLLIDYPEQLKNKKFKGTNKQKEIANFFAFGGDPYIKPPLKKKETENKNPELSTPEPNFNKQNDINISFPNDEPKINNDATIFDRMYNDMAYEIAKDVIPKNGDKTFGINELIYIISGLTEINNPPYTLSASTYISQYNIGNIEDQFGKNILNNSLKDLYDNEEAREYYDVTVWAGTSKLYTELNSKDVVAGNDYNIDLAKRRVDATIILVKKRLTAIFGQTIADKITIKADDTITSKKSNGTIVKGSKGGSEASIDNATKAAIPEKVTKEERYATIHFKRNSKPYTPKLPKTNQDEVIVQNNPIQTNSINDNSLVYEEKTINTGILNGFKAISGNYFQSAFHSQTPEDFHKRLTFLHQCLRQGAAKKYSTIEENGTYRAKNSVFGRQPICILRIADFMYTKIIIETLNIDYTDTTWDLNPEGFGMQPMLANITLNIKIIGGQSLKGPIDALQNAVSYNYYANSTYSNEGVYALPSKAAENQAAYMEGVLATKVATLKVEDKKKNPER